MLNWFFQPTCPVEPDEKQWLEKRLTWLAEQFGTKRLRDAEVVLPTPQFFPDPYDGSPESVDCLLDRICQYMQVDQSRLRLDFYSEADRPPMVDRKGRPVGGSVGLYEEGQETTIWIEVSQLDDPMAIVATLAHELGHVLLLGEGRISQEEDHEPLTDLLAVFLGLGVFSANSTIREKYWTAGQFSGWSIGRQGYLHQRMYGYAFALFARARGEDKPAWARHLRLDVQSAFKRGMRFLASQEPQ